MLMYDFVVGRWLDEGRVCGYKVKQKKGKAMSVELLKPVQDLGSSSQVTARPRCEKRWQGRVVGGLPIASTVEQCTVFSTTMILSPVYCILSTILSYPHCQLPTTPSIPVLPPYAASTQ